MTQPRTSFLFRVNELPVNEELPPRTNENGRWVPPIQSAGFLTQTPGRMFRWSNGIITDAALNGYYWYNGYWYGDPATQLTHYRTTTLFWCDEFSQFLMLEADATMRDIATADFPNNRWYPLTFRHEGTLSRVATSLEEQHLATRDPWWIGQLGLDSYRHRDRRMHDSGGLGGHLSTVFALVAFACENATVLDRNLIGDGSWRRQLRSNPSGYGRRPERGVVTNVYLDPGNPEGSTFATLHHLEWEGGPLIH